jgi:hypothetical protein
MTLARLGHPLDTFVPSSSDVETNAMLAAGHILYCLNRIDVSVDERKANCGSALSILVDAECVAAASIIREFSSERRIWSESIKQIKGELATTTLDEAFPNETATIFRHCLGNADRQVGYFQFFDRDELLAFAITGLGRLGNSLDIVLLKQWASHPRFGRTAIASIARLEGSSPP